MFQTRRRNLVNNISRLGMNMVLIDSPSNLYYYTGFTGGEAMFFMQMTDDAGGYIITPMPDATEEDISAMLLQLSAQVR